MKRWMAVLAAAGVLWGLSGCNIPPPPEEWVPPETVIPQREGAQEEAKEPETPAPWDETVYFPAFAHDMNEIFFKKSGSLMEQFNNVFQSGDDRVPATALLQGRYFNIADDIQSKVRTYIDQMPPEATAETPLAQTALALAETVTTAQKQLLDSVRAEDDGLFEGAFVDFFNVYTKDIPVLVKSFEERADALGVEIEALYQVDESALR